MYGKMATGTLIGFELLSGCNSGQPDDAFSSVGVTGLLILMYKLLKAQKDHTKLSGPLEGFKESMNTLLITSRTNIIPINRLLALQIVAIIIRLDVCADTEMKKRVGSGVGFVYAQ